MDHRLTHHDTIAVTVRVARILPAALAATEDSPLRSTPTDGGSRVVGSHSDPTPSAAMRRRRTDERRRLDQLITELHDTARRLELHAVKVTALPEKVGSCHACVRTGQILSPPHWICIHCIKAADRARRRHTDPSPFDPAVWVERRHTALLTRATKGPQ